MEKRNKEKKRKERKNEQKTKRKKKKEESKRRETRSLTLEKCSWTLVIFFPMAIFPPTSFLRKGAALQVSLITTLKENYLLCGRRGREFPEPTDFHNPFL